MRRMYSWSTRIGTFHIDHEDGRYHPVWNNEILGSYTTPQQAAKEVAIGRAAPLSNGVDTTSLGIPEHVSDWSFLA